MPLGGVHVQEPVVNVGIGQVALQVGWKVRVVRRVGTRDLGSDGHDVRAERFAELGCWF